VAVRLAVAAFYHWKTSQWSND